MQQENLQPRRAGIYRQHEFYQDPIPDQPLITRSTGNQNQHPKIYQAYISPRPATNRRKQQGKAFYF
jgi:hypothetical protein